MKGMKERYEEQDLKFEAQQMKLEELARLAKLATTSAEKFKDQFKKKERETISMGKQLDCVKKQYALSQIKIRNLSDNIVNEMTLQLEGKIKENEMLKEMLKSNKIELMGKEKEIKRLKGKLTVRSSIKGRSRIAHNVVSKSFIKNIKILQ